MINCQNNARYSLFHQDKGQSDLENSNTNSPGNSLQSSSHESKTDQPDSQPL